MGKVLIGVLDGVPYEITCDDEYSFRDFTHRKLTDHGIIESDLSNKIIYASCFSQENPDSHIFPEDMTGVMFYNCNLDNVYIPPGNTVIGGSQRRFKVQNDLRDWEIDGTDTPKEVINKEYWISQGYSVDPKDIPATKLEKIEDIKKI